MAARTSPANSYSGKRRPSEAHVDRRLDITQGKARSTRPLWAADSFEVAELVAFYGMSFSERARRRILPDVGRSAQEFSRSAT
jgi:hypothetical protein